VGEDDVLERLTARRRSVTFSTVASSPITSNGSS
jgi:hypothetical protein